MRCSSCKETKDPSEFYTGHRRCKDCCKIYTREWQEKNLTPERAAQYRASFAAKNPGYAAQKRKEWALKNPERAKEIDRQKYLRRKANQPPKPERGPKLTNHERKKRYFEKHPIKAECMKIYKYAIRRGKLVRGPCSVCGATEGVDGHHTDYTRPLDVVWLCKPHHREAHRTCE